MKTRPLPLGLVLLAAAGLCGCGKNVSGPPGIGTVRLSLTDAPGSYDAVNLVVHEVAIHRGDSDASGWEVIKQDTTSYDLLKLRNGVFATLGVAQVPAGHYTQVRLKLIDGSNVIVGGVTQPLVVPSGLQSGYKLVGQFDVPANDSVDLVLDFDAARSIVLTGDGRYLLKPTARVMVAALTGAISGQLAPAGTAAEVFALAALDTVSSAIPDPDGRFTLPGLLPGSYSVAIHPEMGFRDTTLANVGVQAGSTTELGTIQLTPQ